jgi:DNA-binding MarR family transcriptional regulator
VAASEDNPLLLDRQVCFPLYAASNLIQRLYRPLLAPLGLTYSQYLVMLVLWDREPVSVGDLGGCLHLDNGTMTPLLKRMELGGFVARRRDPKDERRVLIALTDHGRALRARAMAVPAALAGKITMTEEEVMTLYGATRSLVQLLSDAAGGKPAPETVA